MIYIYIYIITSLCWSIITVYCKTWLVWAGDYRELTIKHYQGLSKSYSICLLQ